MDLTEKLGIAGLVAFAALVIAAICGWVMNIVALIAMTGFSGLLALRVVGIFVPPLGAILGFI